MATQTVSHSTATAFQKMGVQRVEALEHWDWYEEVPARIADQPFDFALVVAFAGSAKPILEQVVRLQLGEHAGPLSFAVPEDAGHHDLGVVIQDRLWNPAEECERPNVAVAEGFRCLSRARTIPFIKPRALAERLIDISRVCAYLCRNTQAPVFAN